MTSNVDFDAGHPYLEEGADGGFFSRDETRVMVSDVPPPPTAKVMVERSIDGADWELVGETEDLAVLVDWESWSYGDIQYRVTAFSAEGAAAISFVIVEARSAALWLSGGPGYGQTARLPFDPAVSITAARERTFKRYAGRSLPVAYSGEGISRTVAVSGRVTDRDEETANADDMVRMAQLEEDGFMFRDPDGRRVYGAIDQIQLPRQTSTIHPDGWEGIWGYGFTLTETEQR